LTAKNPERISEELEDNSMRPFTLCVAFSSEDAKGPPIADIGARQEKKQIKQQITANIVNAKER